MSYNIQWKSNITSEINTIKTLQRNNNDNNKPLHDRIQQNIYDNYINLSPSQLFSIQ